MRARLGDRETVSGGGAGAAGAAQCGRMEPPPAWCRSADMPPVDHLRLLPMIHKGTVTGFGQPAPACTWQVTTHWLKRELHSNGIAADAVSVVRPPLPNGQGFGS